MKEKVEVENIVLNTEAIHIENEEDRNGLGVSSLRFH